MEANESLDVGFGEGAHFKKTWDVYSAIRVSDLPFQDATRGDITRGPEKIRIGYTDDFVCYRHAILL